MNPLGRPIHRRRDNIDIDLKEIRCKAVHRFKWIKIGFDGGFLCIYKAANLQATQKLGNFVISSKFINTSRRIHFHCISIFALRNISCHPTIHYHAYLQKINKNRLHYKAVKFLRVFIIWCPEEHDTRNGNKIAGHKIIHMFTWHKFCSLKHKLIVMCF